MSRSIHVTKKNFKELTKGEINEQAADPDSDLKKWKKKSTIKNDVKNNRKKLTD